MPWGAMLTPNRGRVVPLLEESTRGQAHPLAATIALRSMVDFTLANARSSRYGHDAHHLQSCEQLSRRIADWEEIPSHDAYLAAIRQNHARKCGFWKRMQELGIKFCLVFRYIEIWISPSRATCLACQLAVEDFPLANPYASIDSFSLAGSKTAWPCPAGLKTRILAGLQCPLVAVTLLSKALSGRLFLAQRDHVGWI